VSGAMMSQSRVLWCCLNVGCYDDVLMSGAMMLSQCRMLWCCLNVGCYDVVSMSGATMLSQYFKYIDHGNILRL